MTTFTSSLPDDVLNLLNDLSNRLQVPKNKIIEKALRIYMDQINKSEYIHSYKSAAGDVDLLDLAEEGMVDYFNQLNT